MISFWCKCKCHVFAERITNLGPKSKASGRVGSTCLYHLPQPRAMFTEVGTTCTFWLPGAHSQAREERQWEAEWRKGSDGFAGLRPNPKEATFLHEINTYSKGTEEMAQWVRRLAALAEDLSSRSRTHVRQLTTASNFTPRFLMSSSGRHRHLLTCTHACTQTHINKYLQNLFLVL